MAAHLKETTSVTGPSRSSVSLLGTYLQPYWLKVSLLTLLLIGSLGLEPLGPQLIGQLIDSGTLANVLESSEEMRQLWEGTMKHEEKERRQ